MEFLTKTQLKVVPLTSFTIYLYALSACMLISKIWFINILWISLFIIMSCLEARYISSSCLNKFVKIDTTDETTGEHFSGNCIVVLVSRTQDEWSLCDLRRSADINKYLDSVIIVTTTTTKSWSCQISEIKFTFVLKTVFPFIYKRWRWWDYKHKRWSLTLLDILLWHRNKFTFLALALMTEPILLLHPQFIKYKRLDLILMGLFYYSYAYFMDGVMKMERFLLKGWNKSGKKWGVAVVKLFPELPWTEEFKFQITFASPEYLLHSSSFVCMY